MALVLTRGSMAAIYLARGTNNDFSNEAMNEVNLSADGYARYTWYEVSDNAKRYLNDDEVPVFEADTAGNSVFLTITPSEIQYCGGRIHLSTARGATDVVRVKSGHYFTVESFLGCLDWSIDKNWKTESAQHMGDSVPSELLIHKEWNVTINAHWMATSASLTTTGGNANSHITLTHEPGGTDGNAIALTLTDPGAPGSLSVAVTGDNIVVTLAYATGAITTTAKQLATALNCPAVLALGVTAKVKDSETGLGIVAALSHTHLSGGIDPEDYAEEDSKLVVVCYSDYSNDKRHEGYGMIKGFSPKITAGEMIKSQIQFKSTGTPLYWRDP